jgi:hypothetical protein
VVKNKKIDSSVRQRFLDKLIPLWPALKGSLALVYKPCIRPHCRACASGVKHPNHLLTYTQNGRRRCLYVPRSMVPVLEKAMENGRQIEQLLYEMGPALLREYRAEHPAQTGPALKTPRSTARKKKLKS